MSMIEVYGPVFATLTAGVALAALLLFINWLLAPRNPEEGKKIPYECGEHPLGQAQLQLDVQYYLVALIFVIFDIEIVFIAPWVTIYKDAASALFAPMVVFILDVFIAYVYVWKKGGIEWIR